MLGKLYYAVGTAPGMRRRSQMRSKRITRSNARRFPSMDDTSLEPSPPTSQWRVYREADLVVVFVHGFLSNAQTCWTNIAAGTSVFWPDLIASDPRFQQPAIFMATYHTAVDSRDMSIQDCASDVMSYLRTTDSEGRRPPLSWPKLVFVCHSMGGVVVRQLLCDNWHLFEDKQVGVVLIASPSYGARLASLSRRVAAAFANRQGEQLAWGSESVVELDRRFRDLLGDRKRAGMLSGIEFIENRTFLHLKWLPLFTRRKIVDRVSAARYFPTPKVIADADHSTISKPRTVHDRVHHFLFEYLVEQGFLSDANRAEASAAARLPPAVGAPSIYAAGFARRRQLFLDHYTREHHGELSFAGRSNEFAQLDEWLLSHESDILLLTAPAGRGKSALVTRWLPGVRSDFRTIFIPVSIRFGTNSLHDWTQALHQELSLATSGIVDNTHPSITDDYYIGPLYNLLQLSGREPTRNILVVLDGIDESTNREVLRELFPPKPGPGVKILITARDTVSGRDRTRSEWFELLSVSGSPSTRWMQLAKLTPDEIVGSLPIYGSETGSSARARLARVLWEFCDEGDPLLLGLVLSEQQRERVDAASITAAHITRLARGYRGVIDRWIDEQVRLVSRRGGLEPGDVRQVMTRLLALLAHARGPILPSELLTLFRFGFGESRGTASAYLETVDRLVISTADGLVLCHTRIADYVVSADFADEITKAAARRSFVAWSTELAARLEASSASEGHPTGEISTYQLRWGVEHALSDEASTPERLAPFVGRSWLRAKEELDQGTHGFTRDVAAIWRFLRRRDFSPDEPELESRLALEFTCALTLSSNRRFEGIPPALLARQVRARRVSEKTLLDLLVGMPVASLAPYLAALRPHLSAAALRAVRDALTDQPQEPADHVCLLATAENQVFERDFDRAFAFLRTHRFPFLNARVDFAAALCPHAHGTNSEEFFAFAMDLAGDEVILAEDLIKQIIETIPEVVLKNLEEPFYHLLISNARWGTATTWKRVLRRAPHEIVASWLARAGAFRSGGTDELIALAMIGAWATGISKPEPLRSLATSCERMPRAGRSSISERCTRSRTVPSSPSSERACHRTTWTTGEISLAWQPVPARRSPRPDRGLPGSPDANVVTEAGHRGLHRQATGHDAAPNRILAQARAQGRRTRESARHPCGQREP